VEKKSNNLLKLHIGCGKNALDGFINLDNNVFILFKNIPFIVEILRFLKFVPKWFPEFIEIVKEKNIRYCNASKKIPFNNSSVDFIYTCHMLEHLDNEETKVFFEECYRVLKPNCTLRVAVPNFQLLIDNYIIDKNADSFIRNSHLVGEKPKSLLKKIQYILQGHGWHHQMFNENSINSLKRYKFSSVNILKAGKTNVKFHSSLDLNERSHESIYFELIK
jgi:predicted SAM-dependent methyltransferase